MDVVNETSVRVSWPLPSLDRHYMFSITLSNDNASFTATNFTSDPFAVLSVAGGIAYWINISVVALNTSNSRGHWCNTRVTGPMSFRTPAVPPSAPPSSIAAMPLSPVHVNLSWTSPPLANRGDKTLSYLIHVQFDSALPQPRAIPATTTFNTTINVTDGTSVVISLPQPAIVFGISVCVANTAGRGPCSDAIGAQTLPSTPSLPPLNVTLTHTDKSLTLHWHEPALWSLNGDLVLYEVQWSVVNGNHTAINCAASQPSFQHASTHDTSFAIPNYHRASAYDIAVAAVTSAGVGVFSACVYVAPSTTTVTALQGTSASLGSIVGAIVGAVVGLALIVLAALLLLRRRHRMSRTMAMFVSATAEEQAYLDELKGVFVSMLRHSSSHCSACAAP